MPKPELYVIFTGNKGRKPEKISLSKEFFEGADIDIEVKAIAVLDRQIQAAKEHNSDVKKFVQLVKRYTQRKELTYENVHEFIDRILIYELDRKTNTRKIEIFYNFVGKVENTQEPIKNTSYFRQFGTDVDSIVV